VVGGCEPTVEATSYLSPGTGQENEEEGAGRGGKSATWHSFPADACYDATACCPAAKLFLFAAPLLGAGDETSGDDEASVMPLTVGHTLLGEWRCL
jgi:hypothetical protein